MSTPFVGRKEELAELEDAYASDIFEFAVLYGRRRIGKTSLVSEFCKDKRTIFFASEMGSEAMALAKLSQSVSSLSKSKVSLSFASFGDILTYIADLATEERLVFVIDEFPYFAQSLPSAMSTLQHAIDHVLKPTKLMVILLGSSVHFMQQDVLGLQSPLYGRRTRQIFLQSFSVQETKNLCKRSDLDAVIVQTITGGVPLYVEYFASDVLLMDEIHRLFFRKSGLLYHEPFALLSMESRTPGMYSQVLEILASGTTKPSVMADKMQSSSANIASILKTLETLGIVEKKLPFGQKNSRKGVWSICDDLFSFHSRFVAPYTSLIELGKVDGILALVSDQLNQYVGKKFEAICHRYFLQHTQRPVVAIGHWWGFDHALKREEELDLVAKDAHGNFSFGECKWSDKAVGKAELDLLKRRSYLVGEAKNPDFWLFSKSGFTKGIVEEGNIHLVGLEELFL